MLRVDLLDSIPETRYLSAENYSVYRTVMRLFFLEYQKMRYQLDRDDLLILLRQLPLFEDYTLDGLQPVLEQLVKWKNLTRIQDPRKARTIADFNNRRFQYMLSPRALEIERMTVALESLEVQAASLPSGVFHRIQEDLDKIPYLDGMPLHEVGSWWQDLQEDFSRLGREHQDYLREFYGSGGEKRMKAVDFIRYKQNLVRYLEAFIQELQHSAAQIRAQLEGLSAEQVSGMLERVLQSELEIPHRQNADHWQEALRARNEEVWHTLNAWFIGPDATARQVLEVTNDVIRRVVQNAALLVQMENMGVSNKTELRHYLKLFSGCGSLDEAHRLSAMVFGVQRARHFSVNADRTTDRTDLSVYEEPPLRYPLQPRSRSNRPRAPHNGFADKSAEKAAQRQQVLEAERALQQRVLSYIREGRLDFAALQEPVPPDVRAVFLSWVTNAGLDPDGHGYTQYGQSYTMQRRGRKTCQLRCTDGVLTMPDCVLVFEGERNG